MQCSKKHSATPATPHLVNDHYLEIIKTLQLGQLGGRCNREYGLTVPSVLGGLETQEVPSARTWIDTPKPRSLTFVS